MRLAYLAIISANSGRNQGGRDIVIDPSNNYLMNRFGRVVMNVLAAGCACLAVSWRCRGAWSSISVSLLLHAWNVVLVPRQRVTATGALTTERGNGHRAPERRSPSRFCI
ncbi:hypothetical protein Bcep18194_A4501 [Burkholderia lata]|uniref:Uncharacterized protein n=1 Tax=Burkholderia lata (strain ATCC 17760 / DSM 23089 / LMG 22485 / NCIMB 9086 / R18194 / 383) TaxID=482957 RepID=Q39HG9_BURL3|nr:hypothetical protein Bcep18194_A4501 [Burkholderia lata]